MSCIIKRKQIIEMLAHEMHPVVFKLPYEEYKNLNVTFSDFIMYTKNADLIVSSNHYTKTYNTNIIANKKNTYVNYTVNTNGAFLIKQFLDPNNQTNMKFHISECKKFVHIDTMGEIPKLWIYRLKLHHNIDAIHYKSLVSSRYKYYTQRINSMSDVEINNMEKELYKLLNHSYYNNCPTVI